MKSPLIIKRNAEGKNWWVTYKDGALAYPRPLDTREEARKIYRTLRETADLRTEQDGSELQPK